MSNKLICPFCQTELEINDLDVQLLGCENQNCKHSTHYDVVGTKELWQTLIQAKYDLEIATKALKEIDTLLLSRKFDITELGRLNIIQYLVSRALKLTEHKE